MPWAEKLPSGRYRGMYRTSSGAKRSAGTFDHEKHAFNEAAAKEAEATRPGWRDPKASGRTWGAWCDEWWPTRAVGDSTMKVDVARKNVRLMAKWATVPLADITRFEIKKWAAELRDEGLAPATVQRIVHLFSASLTAAVDAEILPTNPAYRLRLPNPPNARERYLTHEEQQRLLAEFPEGSIDEALVATLLGTGLRWGEAAGLTIERIDFRRGLIRVAEVWDSKLRQVKPYPKGKKRRDVPMPLWVRDRLVDVIEGRTNGFVFEVNGKVIEYSNWRNRVWKPAVEAAGVEDLVIHGLRHTYASILVQDGRPLEEVGKLLGHESVLTTHRYAHLTATPSEDVLKALKSPFGMPAPRGAELTVKERRGSRRGADVGQDAVPEASNVLHFTPRAK